MNYNDYVKEMSGNNLITTWQAEKQLADAKAIARIINNIKNMSPEQAEIYGSDPADELKQLELYKATCIKLAIHFSVPADEIADIEGYQKIMNEFKQTVKSSVASKYEPIARFEQ